MWVFAMNACDFRDFSDSLVICIPKRELTAGMSSTNKAVSKTHTAASQSGCFSFVWFALGMSETVLNSSVINHSQSGGLNQTGTTE